ncbi:ferredoxin [Prauserella muralis]|uniref:Ferredoxin n=1 Tax=Prauserella muralis TaxID=588067 RepID=A0A2V4AK32_9PSEU|nr:ferredoxin [Prauserella muralis]PXY19546.1 ferredoxin [Prauserella muralis]TWE29537.1 ferredoxin [Prauserella muralis]
MRIEVDRDLCEANEVCVGIAPAVFELDDDEELRIRHAEVPPKEIERVTQAVASCPRNALLIRD